MARRREAIAASAPSSSWSTRRRRDFVHRGQPAPAGRAHRHRGGDRASTWCRRSCGWPAARRWPSSASRPTPRRAGIAIQLRINMETMTEDGSAKPGGGTLDGVRAAVGPGRARRHLRLCRLPHQSRLRFAARQADRARAVAGLRRRAGADASARWRSSASRASPPTSRFLRALLAAQGRSRADKVHTRFVEEHAKARSTPRPSCSRGLYFQAAATGVERPAGRRQGRCGRSAGRARPSARPRDRRRRRKRIAMRPKARCRCRAPMQGTIVSLSVAEGDAVARRPAAADHGRHEDAARDQEPGARLCAAHRGRGRRDDLRRPCAAVRRGGRCRGEGRGGRGEDRPRPHPPRSRRVSRAPRA